jgi:hypothetical protein
MKKLEEKISKKRYVERNREEINRKSKEREKEMGKKS